jgi:hypothetical protein
VDGIIDQNKQHRAQTKGREVGKRGQGNGRRGWVPWGATAVEMREAMAMATRELVREERVGSSAGLGIIGPHPALLPSALLPRSSASVRGVPKTVTVPKSAIFFKERILIWSSLRSTKFLNKVVLLLSVAYNTVLTKSGIFI